MTYRLLPLLVVVLVLRSTPIVAQRPSATIPFRMIDRTLDLKVDYDRGAVDGTETIVVRNVSGRAAREVPLLLNRLMTVSRIRV